MNADAYFQLKLGLMQDCKRFDIIQDGERHQSNFFGMIVLVAHGQPGDHHVRIADGLDLGGQQGDTEEKIELYVFATTHVHDVDD